MLYEELLMDTPTLLKFKLFKHLKKVGTKSYPIAQIAETMGLNYQQTVIDLTEIDHDLAEIHTEHQSMLIGAGKIDCTKAAATTDAYRYYLLKESVPFQFILYFLNEAEPTIDDFCERYYVSRSTVSRKIANLKKHLKRYHLRFTYTEADLIGDERLVRIALFNTLWLGTRGQVWPLNVSEELAERYTKKFSSYFSLNNSYLGRLEMKLFTGIALMRISKGHFTKYDKSYDFLMQKNSYYDFTLLPKLLEEMDGEVSLTKRQLKAESGFVFFLSHFAPSFTQENDIVLQQTIHDFSTRLNPVFSLVQDFLIFAKKQLFESYPDTLDNPLIIGNLLNVTFAFYTFKQPFPNIQNLVISPRLKEAADTYLETHITHYFEGIKTNPKYGFVNDDIRILMIKTFKNILSPYFNGLKYSKRLKIGMVFEHNYLLVRNLYQFIGDLHFADVEPFDSKHVENYDLIISSSLLLKQNYPHLPVYLWDHTYDDSEMILLYQKLRRLFVEKNTY